MDAQAINLLTENLNALNDFQSLVFYCSLFFAAASGFMKGGQR